MDILWADLLYRQCEWYFDSRRALITGEPIPLEKLLFNVEQLCPQLQKLQSCGPDSGIMTSPVNVYASLTVQSLWEIFIQTGMLDLYSWIPTIILRRLACTLYHHLYAGEADREVSVLLLLPYFSQVLNSHFNLQVPHTVVAPLVVYMEFWAALYASRRCATTPRSDSSKRTASASSNSCYQTLSDDSRRQ